MKRSVALLLLLAACAGPESRVETALRNAGLSPGVSRCMAGRIVDKLSVGQLLKLRSLGGLADRPVEDVSAREFLRRVRALKDPEIVSVVSASLARCSLGV